MVNVTKASGEKQPFNSRKLFATIKEAGASNKLTRETIELVKPKIYEGISTKEILQIILKNLKKEKGVSQRYRLKQAIMELGPTGFPFEQYFAKILEEYGYTTKTDQKIKGKIITHEIDVIATKENKTYMIECKYHNDSGKFTSLHPAMYTYARFLDVKKFDFPWLSTNTKCSDDAVNYAKGVNMKVTSWNYPKNESLKKLIEQKNIFPITILNSLTKETKEKLHERKISTIKQLRQMNYFELSRQIKISEKEAERILNEINDIENY